jgi:hypothetical protein
MVGRIDETTGRETAGKDYRMRTFTRPRPSVRYLLTAVLLLAVAVGVGASAASTPAEVRVDLLELPAPALQPELARSRIVCHLDTEVGCAFIESVLLSMPFAWQHSGYTIHVAYETSRRDPCGRSGVATSGCASRWRREVWVFPAWVRHIEADRRLGLASPVAALTRTVAHEMGHVMHQSCPGERVTLDRYRYERGISPNVPLRGHVSAEGARFASVAEDFAEAASLYLRGAGDDLRRSRSPLAPSPDGAELDRLAPEFFRVCLRDEPDVTVEPLAAPAVTLPERSGGAGHVAPRCSSSMCAGHVPSPAPTTGAASPRSLAAQAGRYAGLAERYAELDRSQDDRIRGGGDLIGSPGGCGR